MRFFRSKKKFNCHFCCKSTSNPKVYKQGWMCGDDTCGQYNGFDTNGNYLDANIINELSPNKPTSYCKPAQIPFNCRQNVFQSELHFNQNTDYLLTSSSAPLCSACQHNQRRIQQKLSQFDAGANSEYHAFLAYRRLLEEQYPLCQHCALQCKIRLNTINHKLVKIHIIYI